MTSKCSILTMYLRNIIDFGRSEGYKNPLLINAIEYKVYIRHQYYLYLNDFKLYENIEYANYCIIYDYE